MLSLYRWQGTTIILYNEPPSRRTLCAMQGAVYLHAACIWILAVSIIDNISLFFLGLIGHNSQFSLEAL